MGDVAGAMRSYTQENEKQNKQMNREIIEKLDKVRDARNQVIQNFTRTKPPKAYAGSDPGQAARAQDQSSKYTQYVQMSTQLMSELQNSERELMDALQTMYRDNEELWESYASIRDEKFRTDERVMTAR